MPAEPQSPPLREVTNELFPTQLQEDADLALDAFRIQFGHWNGQTEMVHGVRAMSHEPSGIFTRSAKGRLVQAWAPARVSDEQIALWRQGMEASLRPSGTTHMNSTLLGAAPIGHCWELPAVGLRLSPPPEGVPQPYMLAADHPMMVRLPVHVCTHPALNGTLGRRQLDWWTHLLNATTFLRCRDATSGKCAWAWERGSSERSGWMEMSYFAPELLDDAAIERAAEAAPPGAVIDDAEYYLRFGGVPDGTIALPRSLEGTLTAADSMSGDHRAALRRACWWISTADQVEPVSRSMAFLALVIGTEAIAKIWSCRPKSSDRFQEFLNGMLPCYSDIQAGAARFSKLRGELAHDGAVFPDDWSEPAEDDDAEERTSYLGISVVCRLACVNWIRSCSALPQVPEL